MAIPTFSIVVPLYNESARIGAVLTVLNRQFAEIPRIFVDGGSTDNTLLLLEQAGETCVVSARGRARQMNAGAALVTTDYLLFLHVDTQPLFGAEQLSQWLKPTPVWGFCPVRFDSQSRAMSVIAWSMNRRSAFTGIATGDQLQWVRREVFEREGGFADIDLMEDVELSGRLKRLARPYRLPGYVQTSARRWQQKGLVRTVLTMWGLRLAYALGVSPSRLHRLYYS